MKINLGAGTDYKNGWVNIDQEGGDIKHDLNMMPWPIKSDSAERIKASHILEHLERPLKAMEEIYRISKHRAEIEIRIPCVGFSSPQNNPEHYWEFSRRWFETLCDGSNRLRNTREPNYHFTMVKYSIKREWCRLWERIPKLIRKRGTEQRIILVSLKGDTA